MLKKILNNIINKLLNLINFQRKNIDFIRKINIYIKKLDYFYFYCIFNLTRKKSCFGKSSLSIAVLVIILRFLDFKFHSLLFSKL